MSTIENKSIDMDFRNLSYLKMFIQTHKDEKFPLVGVNEQKEQVIISAVEDNVDVATYQDNGWVRHNTYWLDGDIEEWFEK